MRMRIMPAVKRAVDKKRAIKKPAAKVGFVSKVKNAATKKPAAKVGFVSAKEKMSAKGAKLAWLKNRGTSKRGEGN